MIAMEDGETFEEIEKRLGTPSDFAKEFNENLSVVKKINKKLIIGLGCCLLLIIVCFIGFQYQTSAKTKPIHDSKIFNVQEVYDSSIQVIDYLDKQDYQGLESMFSDILKKATNKDELFAAVDQLGELGDFKKMGDYEFVEYKDKSGIAAVGDVVVEYNKRTVIYRLSFDEEMKLIGLFMR